MSYPLYIRERARELRTANRFSLDEIADRLALPKTTVYYWIKDLPLARSPRWEKGQRKGTAAMQAKYRRVREDAYEVGLAEYDELVERPTFRDFVALYIAEGYKRDRNVVALANSDAAMVTLAAGWLRRLSDWEPVVRVQYHADQDAERLRIFWSERVGLEPDRVRLYPKSNSGGLKTRIWRCEHGVASVEVYDTVLHARLSAWMDRVRASWE